MNALARVGARTRLAELVAENGRAGRCIPRSWKGAGPALRTAVDVRGHEGENARGVGTAEGHGHASLCARQNRGPAHPRYEKAHDVSGGTSPDQRGTEEAMATSEGEEALSEDDEAAARLPADRVLSETLSSFLSKSLETLWKRAWTRRASSDRPPNIARARTSRVRAEAPPPGVVANTPPVCDTGTKPVVVLVMLISAHTGQRITDFRCNDQRDGNDDDRREATQAVGYTPVTTPMQQDVDSPRHPDRLRRVAEARLSGARWHPGRGSARPVRVCPLLRGRYPVVQREPIEEMPALRRAHQAWSAGVPVLSAGCCSPADGRRSTPTSRVTATR
jgi:hypothetical protein